MTTLLEEILYNSPQMKKQKITITKQFVRDTLKDIVRDDDLSRYIL